MRRLPKQFQKYDFQFEQLCRTENTAIYRRHVNGRQQSFEVIVIRVADRNSVKSDGSIRWVECEPYECYPATEEWGESGWTYKNLEDAKPRYASLNNGVSNLPEENLRDAQRTKSPTKYSSRAKSAPLHVAKAHCANYDNGRCLGISYNDDLSDRSCKALPACLLNEPMQSCLSFEDVVMRITVDDSTLLGAQRKEAFDKGVRQYKLATGSLTSEDTAKRLCPGCKQRPLVARSRFCYACRQKRRKETQKRANRSRGDSKSVKPTTVKPKRPLTINDLRSPFPTGSINVAQVDKLCTA